MNYVQNLIFDLMSRDYSEVEEKSNFKLRVPLATLIEYKGFVGLAIARPHVLKFDQKIVQGISINED